jgi:hypothetical protein
MAAFLADAVERVTQTDDGGGFAFAGGCGADGGDQNQLAVGPLLQTVQIIQRYLGFVMAIGLQMLVGNFQPLAGD